LVLLTDFNSFVLCDHKRLSEVGLKCTARHCVCTTYKKSECSKY